MRWAFQKNIIVYQCSFYWDTFDLVSEQHQNDKENYMLKEVAIKLGMKLLEDGYIETERIDNLDTMKIEFRSKIKVIK